MASLAIPSSSALGTTAPVGLLGLPSKIVFGIGRNRHGDTTGKDDIGLVGHIARVRRDHFITRINDSTHRQVYTLADPNRDKDFLGGVIVQSIATLQQSSNLFAQFKNAIVRCIPRMSLFNGKNTCLSNMSRCDKIWFT